MKSLRNFSYSICSLPLALLILDFGLWDHVTWMGFYWDDWHWVWFSREMGPAGFGGVKSRCFSSVKGRSSSMTDWAAIISKSE